jgi:hypothetical protein
VRNLSKYRASALGAQHWHEVSRCVSVFRGLKPVSSPSPRCLALSVEVSAYGSRSVRIDLRRGTGPLRRWREIGANTGKLSAVIAVCWRRRGRSSIQNQNECEYRCQRYSKNFRVEVIELLFRRLLRFQDRISICPGGGNDGGRAPQRSPRTAA